MARPSMLYAAALILLPACLSFSATPAFHAPNALILRSAHERCSATAISMSSAPLHTRRSAASLLAGALLAGAALRSAPASAEEAAAGSAAVEPAGTPGVCTNILGCKIEGELQPPKQRFKSILEEEQELARQQAEIGRHKRQEKLDNDVKVLRGMFAAVKKGRKELEADIGGAIAAAEKDSEDKKAWDDVRRMSRLYDTGIRKDGMYPLMDRMQKLKATLDRKSAEEECKKLNEALKSIDKAGKKKDVQLLKDSLAESIKALDAWLMVEKGLDDIPPAK